MAAIALTVWASGALQGAEPCRPAARSHAAAAERVIGIETPEGRIAATLAEPFGAPPEAVAVLLHGYTGTRDEIPVAGGEGLFARTARAFAERGIASLRIDFRGSGASGGAWADTTLDGQARDAIAARDFLAGQLHYTGRPVAVLGYSQGGLVALRAGAAFDRIALWNPVLDPEATYGLIFGPTLLAEGVRRAAAGDVAPVGGSGLRPAFFAGIATARPLAEGASLAAPVLVVVGRDDTLVRHGPALAARLAQMRAGTTQVADVAAGHDLGAAGHEAMLDAVIACTAGFLLGR